MNKILVLAVCSVLFLTGCFESTTLITVRKDGSGQILQRTYISPQAQQSMAAFAAISQVRNGAANMPRINMTSNDMKQAAADMGEGVTLVKLRKLQKDGGWEGTETMFAFKDINNLKVSMNPDAVASGSVASRTVKPFQFTKGANPTLSITIPHDKINVPHTGIGSDPASRAIVQKIMEGAKISLFVEAAGQITDSDATFISASANSRFKNRITILDVNMDDILTNPDGLDLLDQLSDATKAKEARLKLAKEVEGIKIENKDKVFLTFR